MIGLYRGVSLVSRAIRWRTWSVYSHAAWIDEDNSVYEAWWPDGVRHVESYHDGHTRGTRIDLFDPGLTSHERQRVIEFYEAQLGKPYDLFAVLAFVSRRRRDDPSRWFCSEVLFTAVEYAGRQVLERIPAYKVVPGHFAISPLVTPAGSLVV